LELQWHGGAASRREELARVVGAAGTWRSLLGSDELGSEMKSGDGRSVQALTCSACWATLPGWAGMWLGPVVFVLFELPFEVDG
jgi:hypothetical protein